MPDAAVIMESISKMLYIDSTWIDYCFWIIVAKLEISFSIQVKTRIECMSKDIARGTVQSYECLEVGIYTP